MPIYDKEENWQYCGQNFQKDGNIAKTQCNSHIVVIQFMSSLLIHYESEKMSLSFRRIQIIVTKSEVIATVNVVVLISWNIVCVFGMVPNWYPLCSVNFNGLGLDVNFNVSF